MKFAPALLLISSLTLSFSVPAQTESRSTPLYRCGLEGRDLRDAPCPAGVPGKADRINFDQAASAQVQAAQAQAAGTSAQADQLAQERAQREAREQRQAASATAINGLAGAPRSKPAPPPRVTELKPPRTSRAHKPKTNASAG